MHHITMEAVPTANCVVSPLYAVEASFSFSR